MWAIKLNGVGNEVGGRPVRKGWPLSEGEDYITEDYEPGMILDADGTTLRHRTSEEVQAIEGAASQRQTEIEGMLADEELRLLAAMSAEEIDAYIDAQMTGVPLKSQEHFKKLTKMIAVLARGVFD